MHANFKYMPDYDNLTRKELAETLACRLSICFKGEELISMKKPITHIFNSMTSNENHTNWILAIKSLLFKIATNNKLNYAIVTLENIDDSIDLETSIEFLEYVNEACAEKSQEALVTSVSYNLEQEKEEDCSESLIAIINLEKLLLEIDDNFFVSTNLKTSLIKDLIPNEILNCKRFSYKRFIVDLFLMCVTSEEEISYKSLCNIAEQICNRYFLSNKKESYREMVHSIGMIFEAVNE